VTVISSLAAAESSTFNVVSRSRATATSSRRAVAKPWRLAVKV
jgi:hypothetical protein